MLPYAVTNVTSAALPPTAIITAIPVVTIAWNGCTVDAISAKI